MKHWFTHQSKEYKQHTTTNANYLMETGSNTNILNLLKVSTQMNKVKLTNKI